MSNYAKKTNNKNNNSVMRWIAIIVLISSISVTSIVGEVMGTIFCDEHDQTITLGVDSGGVNYKTICKKH